MAKQLLLLRHGKSDWHIETDDFSRPLKKRGKKAAEKIGEWLQGRQLTPDWIVSSPAVRTLKTAEKVCKALEIKKSTIHLDERLYEAGLESFYQVLADCPGYAQRILLVGHNPGLESLLLSLVPNLSRPEDGKLLATATLAQIDLPDEWSGLQPASGQLLNLIRATDIAIDK